MPIQDNKYVSPIWTNGSAPNISASELNAISDTVAVSQKRIGDVVITQQSVCPPSFLPCDGSAYNTSDYPTLYIVLGSGNLPYIDVSEGNAFIKAAFCQYKTVSAPIISVGDAAAAPLKALTLYINAGQNGSGTPSAGNPRSFYGFTVTALTVSSENLFDDNAAFLNSSGITKQSGYWQGNAASFAHSGASTQLARALRTETKSANVQFSISITAKVDNTASGYLSDGNGLKLQINYTDGTASTNAIVFANTITSWTTKSVITDANKRIKSFNLTYSKNSGNVWHVKDFMATVSGTVAPYIPFDGAFRTFPLGKTVYGGYYDPLTGELCETHGHIASYDGETVINEPWRSSIDAYVAGTLPSAGAEVVYPLTSPVVTQVGTPQEIPTLYGKNLIDASTGDVKATYLAIEG